VRDGSDGRHEGLGPAVSDVAEITDDALVERCLAGDDRAWTVLLRRHARQVFALAYRSTGRSAEAEDVTQDIFVKVSRSLDRYDRSCAFKPWLLQVARNHLIDHHRSSRRERETHVELDALPIEPGSFAPTQHADLVRRERAQRVAAALAQLPPKLREAVVLRDVEDLDYDEIAAVTGIPLGTVKSRINRGRLQLADILRGAAAAAEEAVS
jgi:RNA polymerase sigma-70 factor (ECF subfamily)